MNKVRAIVSACPSGITIRECLKRMEKQNDGFKTTHDFLVETLNYYKKLQVVHVDDDEVIMFL